MKSYHKNQFRTFLTGKGENLTNEQIFEFANLRDMSTTIGDEHAYRRIECIAKNRRGKMVHYVAQKLVNSQYHFAVIRTTTQNDNRDFGNERFNFYDNEVDFRRALKRMMRRHRAGACTSDEWNAYLSTCA